MVERSEFKGKPVLILKRDENDKYPFAFGLSKAKMMLENIEEIKRWGNSRGEHKPHGIRPDQVGRPHCRRKAEVPFPKSGVQAGEKLCGPDGSGRRPGEVDDGRRSRTKYFEEG